MTTPRRGWRSPEIREVVGRRPRRVAQCRVGCQRTDVPLRSSSRAAVTAGAIPLASNTAIASSMTDAAFPSSPWARRLSPRQVSVSPSRWDMSVLLAMASASRATCSPWPGSPMPASASAAAIRHQTSASTSLALIWVLLRAAPPRGPRGAARHASARERAMRRPLHGRRGRMRRQRRGRGAGGAPRSNPPASSSQEPQSRSVTTPQSPAPWRASTSRTCAKRPSAV